MKTSVVLPPLPENFMTSVDDYISRSAASTLYDLPPHIIDYWVSRKAVRVTEFKKDGDIRRSSFVNKQDVKNLKVIYEKSLARLQRTKDQITFKEALEDNVALHDGILRYLIRNCMVESYTLVPLDLTSTLIRRSTLKPHYKTLKELDNRYREKYNSLRECNKIFTEESMNARLLYLRLFFETFPTYNFCPIIFVHSKFIVFEVNTGTKWKYNDSESLVEMVLSGEMNGVLGGRTVL